MLDSLPSGTGKRGADETGPRWCNGRPGTAVRRVDGQRIDQCGMETWDASESSRVTPARAITLSGAAAGGAERVGFVGVPMRAEADAT